MIKFEKLSIDSMTRIKKRIILLLAGGTATALLSFGSIWLTSARDTMQDENNTLHSKQSEIVTLQSTVDNYHETLKGMSYQQSAIISKEDLVIALGECAKEADCDITGLSSKTISEEKSITRYNLTFEVKGSMSSVAKVLKNIDAKNMHYAVNELSLRQEADYLWLQRDFQDNVNWWDLSNIATKGGSQAKNKVSSEDILSDTAMKFYLDLDFIVISEVM